MTDNVNKLSQQLELSKSSSTAALANLTDEDVVKIWDSVSHYIESFLKQSKGVIIPGFGTFSFIQKRIDVGNNKYLLLQRPVFVLSEKVVQTHGLKTTHYPVNGSIPVHPLNYFSIQQQSIYTRDQIEQCVKHVLQVFHRSIASQRNVEFTFSRIGKLQIRENKAKMRFFKDFIQSVDENAAKHLIESMCNRPQTCDSVMSEHETARPLTASNVVLPRLNSRMGTSSMHVIQEENNEDENAKDSSTENNTDDLKLPPLTESTGGSTNNDPPSIPHLVKTTGSVGLAQENNIPVASLFSSIDFLPKKPSTAQRSPVDPQTINPSGNHSVLGLTRPVSTLDRRLGREHLSSSMNFHPKKSSTSACGHYGPGQELCHLCTQRAKRNIPVYLHEEKKIREETEEKLLEDYRHQKELQEKQQQELALKTAREEKQRIAAYNFGVAEAKRTKKLERPQTTDVQRSIIFRKRTRTPPHYLRQQDLARQLESQIKAKKDEEQTEQKDKDFLERLEQIQLAESLVQERETYLKNKRLHQATLRNALDEQIRNKSFELPSAEADAPYFGLNDMTKEKFQQRRLQAVELLRQQKELIEQRQRKDLLKQIEEQNYQSDVLKSIKDDLIADTRQRHDRALRIRKDLEKNWNEAAEEKHKRDEEEHQHLLAPQGVLLHEQCDQYKRCAQCQRDLKNRGESHFWKDTRYIPGTHIIV